jgi:hypothetical protein
MFYDVHVEQDKSLSVDIYLGGMKIDYWWLRRLF